VVDPNARKKMITVTSTTDTLKSLSD